MVNSRVLKNLLFTNNTGKNPNEHKNNLQSHEVVLLTLISFHKIKKICTYTT